MLMLDRRRPRIEICRGPQAGISFSVAIPYWQLSKIAKLPTDLKSLVSC